MMNTKRLNGMVKAIKAMGYDFPIYKVINEDTLLGYGAGATPMKFRKVKGGVEVVK